MERRAVDRRFGTCIVAAGFLTACGGTHQAFVSSTTIGVTRATPHHQVFNYTGSAQSFVVPEGVTHIKVVARGASGPIGTTSGSCRLIGGLGGLVHATINVTHGETLALFVGGEGTIGGTCHAEYGNGAGGFNGGGSGGPSSHGTGNSNYTGDGGGGASDVRQGGTRLDNRIIVAGGGGGAGGLAFNYGAGNGGIGGGKVGGKGSGETGSGYCLGWGGHGGTQTKGGKGGRGGPPASGPRGQRGKRGKAGIGGDGGSGTTLYTGGGGGGGGGYYGGGGGGSGADCTSSDGAGGGGGGGSSYVEPQATNVKDQGGAAPPGNGQIVISWSSIN